MLIRGEYICSDSKCRFRQLGHRDTYELGVLCECPDCDEPLDFIDSKGKLYKFGE